MKFYYLIFIAVVVFLVEITSGIPVPSHHKDTEDKNVGRIISVVATTINNGEGDLGDYNEKREGKEEDLFDDNTRFNLNTGIGVGVKQNQNNQFGIATHNHHGYGSAIKSPDGRVTNLGQYGNSGSSAWGTGYGAPNSFASGGSQIRPGYSGGQTTIGGGGHGTAFSQDQSTGFGINLPNGSTYLSNLKT